MCCVECVTVLAVPNTIFLKSDTHSQNIIFCQCLNSIVFSFPDVLYLSGMMETVRIRRSGYPVRREFKDFLFRYGVLGREVGRGLEEKEKCVAVLRQHDATNRDWQLGKTKVHSLTRWRLRVVVIRAKIKA